MSLFHFSTKNQAAITLKSRTARRVKSSCKHQKDEALKNYCEVLKYLLEAHATDNTIPETEAETMRFTQFPNKTCNRAQLTTLDQGSAS